LKSSINKKYSSQEIAQIIDDGIKKNEIRKILMQPCNLPYSKVKKLQEEFCRFIGFCILFRSTKNIEKYMLLKDKKEQMDYIKSEIINRLGILPSEVEERKEEIREYALNNFKRYGFVFHAGNSKSINKKMEFGLNGNNNNEEHQKELLEIEKIYRKYDPDNLYSPLGFASADIKEKKNGWFFDGWPLNATGYANSPQWFSYFCGKSYIYFDDIPEEKRNGYANRDFETSLEAVAYLIKSRKMSREDGKEILKFFYKFWNEYKNTTPCLMFIPVKEVGLNTEKELEKYLTEEGMNLLFEDIVQGKVNSLNNYCCRQSIIPDKLAYVDLSPILPKKIINVNKNNIVVVEDSER